MSILDNFIKKKETIKKDDNTSEQSEVNIFTNARYRAEEFIKEQPLYYDIHGAWWKWDKEKCYWQYVEDDIEILNLVFGKYLWLDLIKSRIRTETLESLRQVGRTHKPEDIKDSWVQYGKNIYDIATGEKFAATPKYFNTNPIFVDVGDSEDTPAIDKLFNSWVSKEDVQKLYEKIAFTTIPKMIIHSFDVFYGPPGGGKSTAVNLIEKFVGKHNCTATSIERINCNPRFESVKFHKKLLVKISEVSNSNDLKNSAIINNATGEDDIPGEYKGGKTFEFKNYGKFFNPTNKLLKVESVDGFGRRVRVMKFINRFEKESDVISEIPEYEFKNLAKKCLRIANELWINRKFTGDTTISKRMEEYQEISKTDLEIFIKENYDFEFDAKTSFAEFKVDYADWLKKHNKIPVTDSNLRKELINPKAIGLIINPGAQNVKFIFGLKRKSIEQENVQTQLN